MKIPEGAILLMPDRCDIALRPAKDGVRLSYYEWFTVPPGESEEAYLVAAQRAISWLKLYRKEIPGLRIEHSGVSRRHDGWILAGFQIRTDRCAALAMLLGEIACQYAAETSWDSTLRFVNILPPIMGQARLVRPGERLSDPTGAGASAPPPIARRPDGLK